MENYPLAQHVEHDWSKVGRCVYCDTCGVRLYQGDVPRDQTTKREFAASLDAIIAKALEQHP